MHYGAQSAKRTVVWSNCRSLVHALARPRAEKPASRSLQVFLHSSVPKDAGRLRAEDRQKKTMVQTTRILGFIWSECDIYIYNYIARTNVNQLHATCIFIKMSKWVSSKYRSFISTDVILFFCCSLSPEVKS